MSLVVRCPDSLRPERAYAAHVVLQVGLGLAHEVRFEPRADVAVHPADDATRVLHLPDHVFAAGDAGWPATAVRPSALARPAPDPERERRAASGRFDLEADVFGTAFWYLARLEEVLSDVRDQHARFPAEASLDENQRPVVDELVDTFGACLKTMWPALELRRHVFELAPTHDVDRPFKHLFQDPRKLLRGMARDALDRVPLAEVARAPALRRRVRDGHLADDPFNTFAWLMDRSEERGLKSTFYFICGDAPGGIDGDYRIDDPRIRGLLRAIHERGHRIGLHGSYLSAFDAGLLRSEVARLRSACAAEGFALDTIRARQHVLRFDPRRTVGVWAEAGIDEDSTLGHASLAGFRCGTCRPFPLFDVSARRMTTVIERPLVVMDVTLTERRYESLAPEQADARIEALALKCRQVQGGFVLLWHNCRLESPRQRSIYGRALGAGGGAPAPESPGAATPAR